MADVEACAGALEERFGVDRMTALRFSRARQGNLVKAERFLAADLEWREQTKPETLTQDDVMSCLGSGQWRLLGKSSSGFAVLFICTAYWNPTAYDAPYYGRFVTWFIERMVRIGERFVVVLDFEGWKLSHGLQLRKIFALISTLQDHFPERLEAAVLMRVPTIFQATWRVAKTFFDPITAAKVHFVAHGAEAEHEALRTWGAWALWPKSYGGPATAPVPCPNIPGEPNVDSAPLINSLAPVDLA